VLDPPHTLQYQSEEIKAAVAAARDWDTYVAAHVFSDEGIRRCVEAGVISIEHGFFASEETLRLMKDKGVLACLLLLFAAPHAIAIRPGGVVRGGIRGAMVGGMIGGKKGAKVGRTVGAVRGGVRRANYRGSQRAAIQSEAQARAAYRAVAAYRAGVHSHFHAAPPRVIVRPPVVVIP
jgi:imidazolonepropionase-like amidohydrolase